MIPFFEVVGKADNAAYVSKGYKTYILQRFRSSKIRIGTLLEQTDRQDVKANEDNFRDSLKLIKASLDKFVRIKKALLKAP